MTMRPRPPRAMMCRRTARVSSSGAVRLVVDGRGDLLGRGVHVQAVLADRGVVDQRVERAEPAGGLADEGRDARRVGHVDRADVERVGVRGGEVLELGRERAGERRDPRAAGERVAHDREAESP